MRSSGFARAPNRGCLKTKFGRNADKLGVLSGLTSHPRGGGASALFFVEKLLTLNMLWVSEVLLP